MTAQPRRCLAAVLVAGLIVGLNACGSDDSRTANSPPAAGATPGATGPARGAASAQHREAALGGMSGMDMTSPPTASASSGPIDPPPPTTHGFKLNVPLARPDFVLTDSHGRRYDFGARTRGRATLLYFGYTNCPYQCPTMMADIAVALGKLPKSVRSKVTVVFVTTDPARDSPRALRRWLSYYQPPIIGLTGTRQAVEAAQTAAHVTVSAPQPKETAPPGPASTAHGGGLLAYGTDDYAHLTYPAGTSSADLIHDLPGLVRGTGKHGIG